VEHCPRPPVAGPEIREAGDRPTQTKARTNPAAPDWGRPCRPRERTYLW
jgi:hypothetical protein